MLFVVKRVGIFEGKTHFSALIEEVRGGETVIVTKNGAPVAKIVPIGSDDDTERAAAMQSILGSTIALAPLTIRELVDEGRHH